MKKLIFFLLLALPFVGFGQAAYLMEFTNMNGSKVVFNLNDVRSCVAEGSGAYLFTRTGSGKTQVQESPATIVTNSCGNIVLFTVYSPGNQFNTTKQMGVNPNYVIGVVSNTSGDGVLKMITPTENFTTTATYDAAVALLSVCVSGGGGGGSLTNTYVGFGDGLNQLDGEAGFTYDAESNRLAVDTVKTKRIASKSGQLEILNDTKLNAYPNTRNDTGVPINILSTSAAGVIESHPVSDLRDSIGIFDTIATYTALRAYVGKAKVVFVQDWTYTFNSVSYTTIGGLFHRVATGTEDGGTIIAATNGVKWARQWDLVHVLPEWWVVGGYNYLGQAFVSTNVAGGIYNEADRLISATLTRSSLAGVIVLSKGKQYLIDRTLPLQNGQRIEGNDATLKRIDCPNVLLTAGSASGATTLTVSPANSQLFRVGQNVLITKVGAIPYNGVGFDENVGALDVLQITGINSGTGVITLINPLPAAVNSGWRLILNYAMVSATSTTQLWSIKDLNIDGNKAGNAYSVDWRVLGSIGGNSLSVGGLIDHCFFKDTPSENIVYGNIHIRDSRYSNLNGSFLHISTTNTGAVITVENCSGSGSNKATTALMNHSEALITSSANSTHLRLFGGNFEDGDEAVFTCTTTADFDWTVTGAEFNNFKYCFFIASAAAVRKFARINNCTFMNCGPIIINPSGNIFRNESSTNITINDNTFYNCRVEAQSLGYLQVINNYFLWDESLVTKYDYSSNTLNGQNAFFHFISIDRLLIQNNLIEHPRTYAAFTQFGLMIQHSGTVRKTSVGANTEYLWMQDVKVNGNSLWNMKFGICTGSATVPQNVSTVVEAVGWEYRNNIVYMTRSAGGSGGTGIYIDPGVRAEGNTVYTNTTAAAFCGIMVKGVAATGSANTRLHGGYCQNNKVLSCTGSTTADIISGTDGSASYNQTITNNETRDDIYTSYTGGFSGYMSGNYKRNTINYPTLSAETCPFYQDFGENANQY